MRSHKNRLILSLLAPAFLIATFPFSRFAQAATITVVNLDGPSEGFNDPTPVAPVGGNPGTTLGVQRLNAFQFAANLWGALLNSSVEIRVGANFDPLLCSATSGVLGSAGPETFIRDFTGAPAANTWFPIALANSLAGIDLDPSFDDIGATFNSGVGTAGCLSASGWYYGLDANPPSNRIDFVSVVLHELAHGLGFLTLVDLATGAKALGFDDAFMFGLENHSTGKLYPNMTNAERVTASVAAGNLHWVGPNVVAASGFLTAGRDPVSGHVAMFAPNPQQPGSSVSHFSNTLFPNELMEPAYTGPNHNVTLTVELFKDIGWNNVTPPPVTRTLTIASTNPASGVSITVSPLDNSNQGNGVTQFTRTYNNNTLVTLTAPATAGGNTFQKWQRDGVDWATTTTSTVTMDAPHIMTAVYGSSAIIFQDNMENGINGWSPQAPWAQTTASSHSPTHSWTDSPGGNYSNNANFSLWSPVLNFSGLSSITLAFWHRYDLQNGFDFGNVWVTTDNGATFTQVASFTGTNTNWSQPAISLDAFAGQPSVRIVFQLLSNGSVTRDGWYIDDVLVLRTAKTALVSAVGPNSRSVQVGNTATAFALILNYGTATALGCSISPVTSLPATFSFQALNCATNLPLAALNTPVDIPAGGAGCFIFALTPSSPIAPTNMTFNFDCTNSDPAPLVPGVNTFLFSSSTTPTLDLIASALTDSNDAILNLPGANGANFIVVGTANVGSTGGTLTAEANTGGVPLPVTLSLCQWNTATASCMAPFAPSVTTTVGPAGGGQDFVSLVVLVQGAGNIVFEPGSRRVFITLHEGATTNGPVRGLTSVAVRTQ